MQEPPFHHLLDSETAPDERRRAFGSVVRRHRRRRAGRIGAVSVAVVVVLAGTAVGLDLSSSSTGGPRSASGTTLPSKLTFVPSGSAAGKTQGSSMAAGAGHTAFTSESPPCSQVTCGANGLFISAVDVIDRSVGSIRMRAYVVRLPSSTQSGHTGSEYYGSASSGAAATPMLPDALPWCQRSSEILVQISVGSKPIGEVAAPLASGSQQPIEAVGEERLVPLTGRVVLIATAAVSPDVRRVTATFASGGSDAAIADDGVVVLVGTAPRSASLSTEGVELRAVSAAGRTLGTADITAPGQIGIPISICSNRASARP